jgi:hypothetical protein
MIEKKNSLSVPFEVVEGFEPVEEAPTNDTGPMGVGGVKGKRPSKKDKLRAIAQAQ